MFCSNFRGCEDSLDKLMWGKCYSEFSIGKISEGHSNHIYYVFANSWKRYMKYSAKYRLITESIVTDISAQTACFILISKSINEIPI